MELALYRKKIADRLHQLVEKYLKTEDPLSATLRCCFSLKSNELSIICINRENERNEIKLIEKLHFDDLGSLSLVLKGMAENENLSLTPIYWLLGPDDYELNLIESMPVPKNELVTALTWRVRSLINYPVDDAALEYFELPSKKSSSNTPLIATVTAKKETLSKVVSLFKNCNLHLVTIDIPELALLHLAALYEDDEKTTAFIYLYEQFVILNISNKKVLYFTRRIAISMSAENHIDYEKLSLEILRYFDFVRSQWRLSSPTRILVAAETGEINLIAQALSERLMNPVQPYTINSALLNDKDKEQITAKYLLNYGCLLRKDNGNVATRN